MVLRKLTSILLALIVAATFAGCTKTDTSTTSQTQSTSQPDSTSSQNSPPSVSGQLQNDIYSFEARINGTLFQFPCPLTDLTSLGWELQEASVETLEPGSYVNAYFSNEELAFDAYVVNTSDDPLPLAQCALGGVLASSWDEKNPSIVLPAGIAVGTPYDEVISAYGEPSDLYEGQYGKTLTYSTGNAAQAIIYINADNMVDELDIRNFSQRQSGEVNLDQLPEETKQYRAPNELGGDWTQLHIQYGEELYTIPTPVAEFIRKGWTLVSNPEEKVEPNRSVYGIELRKDNQVLRTSVHNFCDSQQTVIGCFIEKLEYNIYGTKIPIQLPGGITENSTREETEAVLGAPNDTHETSSYITYIYGDVWVRLEISFDKETAQATKIVVERTSSDFPY